MKFWKDEDIQALVRKSEPTSSAASITSGLAELLRQDIERIMQDNPALLGRGPRIVFPVEQSVRDDAIVCLFDGTPCKFIKKHLITRYGMKWGEYLEYCGLPSDYPDTPVEVANLRSAARKAGGEVPPNRAATLARPRRPRPED